MTDSEINVAIAEVCGQKWESHPAEWCGQEPARWLKPQYWTLNGRNRPMLEVPNYCTDLNAMHEAEKSLTDEQFQEYCDQLGNLTWKDEKVPRLWHSDMGFMGMTVATARQRAEAFLRTINKWTDK